MCDSRGGALSIPNAICIHEEDFGFFWYFYQDGNIQFEIKLTGVLSMGTLHAGEKPKYGALIAPQLYAPNHQHFFNVRLDFDIDGTVNTMQQVDIESVPMSEANDESNP